MPARTDDPARLLFRPLEPFLVEGNFPVRPGQIRRASLLPIWQWLVRDGAPDRCANSRRHWEGARRRRGGRSIEAASPQVPACRGGCDRPDRHAWPGDDKQRALARVGAPDVVEDLLPIGCGAAGARGAGDAGQPASAGLAGASANSEIASVVAALNVPSLQTPQLLPFALSLVMQRLTAPWQIIRLAIKMAASDDEIRVAATPYGVAVTIALHDLFYLAADLRTDIRRGHFDNVGDNLKIAA